MTTSVPSRYVLARLFDRSISNSFPFFVFDFSFLLIILSLAPVAVGGGEMGEGDKGRDKESDGNEGPSLLNVE